MTDNTLPDHWREIRIDEFSSLVGGGTPSRQKPSYFNGDIPWLTGYDLPESKVTTIYEGRERITEQAIRESATALVPPGTVLLTTRVTVGKTAVTSVPMCFSQDLTGLTINDEFRETVVDPYYLAYCLFAFKDALLKYNRGTTITGVTRGDVGHHQIPLPPFPEQQRIVAILRKADELRQLRRRANERTKDLLPALFYEMFGDPIEARSGWKKMRLGEFVDVASSLVNPTEKQYNDYFHVGSDNIESLTGRFIDLQTIGDVGSISGKFLFTPEHVLYSKIRPALVKVATPEFSGLCSADIYPLTFDEHVVTRQVLAQLLRSNHFTAYASKVSGRAQIPKINREDLFKFQTFLPDLDSQLEFEERANRINSITKITNYAAQRINTLFQSLLARAFTGELTAAWREAHAEELAEAAAERDRLLGIEPRLGVPDKLDLSTEEGQEAFEEDVQDVVVSAATQLATSAGSPVALAESLQQGTIVVLSQHLEGAAAQYATFVDSVVTRSMQKLGEEQLRLLAATLQPLQQMAQETVSTMALEWAQDIAQIAAILLRRPDVSHPRYAILRALSDSLYLTYLAVRSAGEYVTAETLTDDNTVNGKMLEQDLELLAASGLIQSVSVPTKPAGDQIVYVRAYRMVGDVDDSRSEDVATLKELAS